MINKFLLLILTGMLIAGCTNQDKAGSETGLTKETKALFKNLQKVAQSNVLFGHEDAVAYGIGWTGEKDQFESDVQKVSGDHPAVYGWDIGHIDSTANIDSIPFEHMKAWIIQVYEKGGINTISWHARNFLTGGTSWDTSRMVDKILPDGEWHEFYLSKLDKVADFIQSLETSEGVKVPVIFRPYHEHNGHWFWWGDETCTDQEFKELWQFTADYLRIDKQLNNMLLCYSTDAFDDKADYMARYPGDDYVDVFGFDDYKSIVTADTRETFVNRLTVVNALARERDKVAALSEGGYETIPHDTWWTDVLLDGYKAAPETDHVSYILVWRNADTTHHYAAYPGHPSSDNFIQFKNDSLTMFLNDLPDMYSIE